MAGTSGAGGGSPLGGIPGLTRTYAPGEKEPAFADLLGTCTTSAVHLEMHDQNLTSDPAFQAWLDGRPAPQDPAVQYGGYTAVVRDAVRRGVRVRRARIIGEPVSAYVRWEHALTGPVNVAAGEQVRWLPRQLASTLALPGNPYWVFDGRLVRFTVFDGDGTAGRKSATSSTGPGRRPPKTSVPGAASAQYRQNVPTSCWPSSAVVGMWVTYQRLNRAGLRRAQQSVRPAFEQAALIRSYQPRIIPGLLQIPAYTTVMLEVSRDRQGAGRFDIVEAVAERMDRQQILTRAGHRFEFVIEEQVLRYQLCATRTLSEQLQHLRDVSRLAQVSLGIIPQRADRHGILPSEGFVMFDTGLVIVELVSDVLSVTQPREIAMYTKDFTDLASVAVYGGAARQLIATALGDLG